MYDVATKKEKEKYFVALAEAVVGEGLVRFKFLQNWGVIRKPRVDATSPDVEI